jgi:hypothetical protein
MASHSPATIWLINLHQPKKPSDQSAIYPDFLGMIERGNHLPINENQPTNKFLKKFIEKPKVFSQTGLQRN